MLFSSQKYFLISLVISSLTHWLFRNVLFNFTGSFTVNFKDLVSLSETEPVKLLIYTIVTCINTDALLEGTIKT